MTEREIAPEVKQKCSVCEGKQYVIEADRDFAVARPCHDCPPVTCPNCEGTLTFLVRQSTSNACPACKKRGLAVAADYCPKCDGTRWEWKKHECRNCKGTGKVAPYCKTCNNYRWTHRTDPETNNVYRERCPDCKDIDAIIRRFNRAKLPSKYVERGFEMLSDIDFSNYLKIEEQNATQRHHRDGQRGADSVRVAIFQWLAPFVHEAETRRVVPSGVSGGAPGQRPARSGVRKPRKGLILLGPTGTGKTHLLCTLIADLCLKYNKSVRFVEYTHLLSDLREAFGSANSNSAAIIKDLLNCDILAIDEIGKGQPTAWRYEVIDELISRAYNSGTLLLGTSNLSLTAEKEGNFTRKDFLESNLKMVLKEAVGDRPYSRLMEMVDFLDMEGADYRRQFLSLQSSKRTFL